MDKIYEKLAESKFVNNLKVNKNTYLLYLLFFLTGYFFGTLITRKSNVINASDSSNLKLTIGNNNGNTKSEQ